MGDAKDDTKNHKQNLFAMPWRVITVKPWIHEEILKSWTDAQKRLWESLCAAVPFQPPSGVEAWRETYLKNLASWEAAVKRTLEKEAAWVEEWVQRVAREKGTPEMMAAWVQQMEEVLHRWIQTQNQWWDDYFAVLRRGGFMQSEGFDMPPAPTAETMTTDASLAAATQFAPGAELQANLEPPPVIAEPVIAEPVGASVETAPDSHPESLPEPLPEPITLAVETAPMPVATPGVASSDDLKLISGIGPAMEKKLNACGVLSFRDLATLDNAHIERIEAVIKFAGRIHREDWMGQAKAQHFQKYHEQL
ncbi:MAG: hypothetical protein HC889_03755 [Synechococcaceae cyanobacterium SM1_2_3]|nr:hypothetical protein [Synechococcaceae cyanobacterium SM1_2_3]